MIVRRKEVNLSEPGVPSPVAYRHMRRWQRRGVKLPGQSNLVRKSAADGRETEGGDSEHPMESGGEAARQGQQMRIVATVVKRTKPKDADRLEPKKVRGRLSRCLFGTHGRNDHRRKDGA
jgi:hypothetical protein